MKRSLFIYESHYGTAKRTAEICALLAGNSKTCSAENVKIDCKIYNNIIFVVGFHGINTAEFTKKYIIDNREILNTKTIGLIGVGLSQYGSERYLESIENALGRKADYVTFIHGEVRVNKLTDEDKESLKDFLSKQNLKLIDLGEFKVDEVLDNGKELSKFINKPAKELSREELKKAIDEFIGSQNTCALATGDNNFIRCTPIEFIYHNNNLYFITEGGLKFRGILQNGNVSVAMYENYNGFNNLKGLQAEGKGEIVEINTKEYKEIMKIRGIKEEFLNKAPVNMNLIRVKIKRFEFLNSDFKKMGVDAKQIYIF